jgi:soluble lytic murein transglycosylase-like protein
MLFRVACCGLLALLSAFALGACTSAGRDHGPTPVAGRPSPSHPLEARGSYRALVARYAAENGVPLPLAYAVVEHESGFNPNARGRGTVGLMQIKPATARGIGYRGSTAGLYDPATNLKWGMRYLGGAYRLGGGDICATALRYQGGHRAARHTAASRRYCAELKALIARSRS